MTRKCARCGIEQRFPQWTTTHQSDAGTDIRFFCSAKCAHEYLQQEEAAAQQ
jgi:YHS domain-containing protein